jgi:hypothetical protein
MRSRASLPAVLTALALVAACDRRLEPWVPPEQEPPPAVRPVRVPGLETPEPQTPPLLAQGAQAVPGVPGAGAPIRGTVRLAPGVAPPDGGVLFVIARRASAGPPLAAKRFEAKRFPVEFEIGPADVMMPGTEFSGDILLSARIDADGDPMTRGVGEPAARSPAPVPAGSSGVELVLALEPSQ